MSRFSRRNLLQAAGVGLALPVLDVFGQVKQTKTKRRIVAIDLGFGLHAPNPLWPTRYMQNAERSHARRLLFTRWVPRLRGSERSSPV